MNTAEHQLIELGLAGLDGILPNSQKILQLPPKRQAEVVDFVDFLRSRETDHELTQAASQTAVASFAAVWDNDTDSVYDKLNPVAA